MGIVMAARWPDSRYSRDRQLESFDPLERILYFDDFDDGNSGWSAHIGNYEGSLDTLKPAYSDLRPVQLSNLTMWDVGTVGSLHGTYALKLATRPRSGHMSVAIKRGTWRSLSSLRFEAYLAYKTEASELSLGNLDVRAFGVGFDLQDDEVRWMPQYRCLTAVNGEPAAGERTNQSTLASPKGRWQQRNTTGEVTNVGESGATISHWHLADEGWFDIPGGQQIMCYNEIPTKVNWFYLSLDLDLRSRRVNSLRCNDLVLDSSTLEYIELPAMPNLRGMLNAFFWIQTDRDKRAMLYVDSVMLSAGSTY